jgi:Zn-dependent M16 (insulinase) family peptidase
MLYKGYQKNGKKWKNLVKKYFLEKKLFTVTKLK